MSEISIPPTHEVSTSTKPTYEELEQTVIALQSSLDTLRENYDFTINAIRTDRDFYMGLYAEVLREVAG